MKHDSDDSGVPSRWRGRLFRRWQAPKGIDFAIVGLLVLVLIAGVGALVHQTGGIKYVYAHAMYVPVVLGGIVFGSWGGIATGLVGGLVLGPWMPISVETGEIQVLANWLFRMMMFVVIGGSLGWAASLVRNYLLQREQLIGELRKTTGARDRAEADVRRSETVYRSLFDDSPVAHLSIDARDGSILEANAATATMFGYALAELRGMKVLDLYADATSVCAKAGEAFERFRNGERIRGEELQVRRKDGTCIWVSLSVNPIVDEAGKVLESRIVLTDIRAIKNAEQALRQSEERFRGIAEAIDEVIWLSDPGVTKTIYVNPAYENIWGRSRENLYEQSTSFLDAIHPEDRGRVASALSDHANGDYEVEYRIVRSDGTQRWIHDRGFPIRDSDGRLLHMAGIAEDVTEAKRSREQIEKLLAERTERLQRIEASERHLRRIIDGVGPGIFIGILSLEGVVIEANRPALQAAGLAPGDVIGKPVADTYWWSHSEKARERVRQAIKVTASGETVRYDDVIRGIGDRLIAVNFRFSPFIDDTGQIVNIVGAAVDITDRRQAEEERRAHERMLRLFIDHAPAAIAMFDREMRYLAVSRRWLADYGLGERNLSGLSHYDVFPEIPQRWKDVHLRGLAGEAIREEEDHFERVDGTVLWLRWEVRPWLDHAGAIGGIIIFTEDITERKRIERALRRNEKQLEEAQEIARIGSWELDPASSTGVWSRQMYRLLGRNPVHGPPSYPEFLEMIHSDDRKKLEMANERLVRTGEPLVLMIRSNPGQDAVRFFEARARVAETDTEGRPTRLVGTLMDTTAQEASLAALRENEERLRLAVRTGNIGLWDWDLTTDRVRYSPEWKRQIGYAEEEIRDDFAEWRDRVHPDDIDPILEKIEAYLGGIVPGYTVEFRFRHKDGSYRWILASGAKVVDPATSHERFIGTHVDITERKELEEQLRQVQKMESIGRLAGGVAHDYNNILGVVIGYAGLALKKTETGSALRKYLNQIIAAAERSRDITEQLLAFARKEVIAPQLLDLNATIENTLKMLRRLLGEDVKLTWIPGDQSCMVLIDPSQIIQVLTNLCINARDAIADVGTISVGTGVAVFDREYCKYHADSLPGEFVRLSVSDDGCGMDKEILDKIFEPFFTTKPVGKGTGMGLATIYGIVKQNNGFINVYSEPGHGSNFNIYLPRQRGEMSAIGSDENETTPAGAGEMILVVDDELSILALVETILADLNYKVVTARSPSEALQKARQWKGSIELLLTDVIMPEMNGRDLARAIRREDSKIRCLFMSGYPADVVSNKGIVGEAVDYIQKPFSDKSLAVKVRQTLDREEEPTLS